MSARTSRQQQRGQTQAGTQYPRTHGTSPHWSRFQDAGPARKPSRRILRRPPLGQLCNVAGAHEDIGRALLSDRSEEHTSELQSLMRISYAVFCLKQTNNSKKHNTE